MKRYSIAITVLIFFCGMLIPGYSISAENSLKKEEEANSQYQERKFPTGWINSVSANSVIIDDTHYILNGRTQYPDGKSKLKEGVFVQFKIKIDNILSQISITEPLEEDMYMKPIVRSNKQVSEESSENGGGSGSVNQGGMHLENGVWVN